MTTSGGAVPVAAKGFVIRAQARWYDLLAAVLTLGRERAFRERLTELARLAPGEDVLDVGCGTGSLALAAKQRVGEAGTVTGVDASPEMIVLATRKTSRAHAAATFRNAAAEHLPFPDATFDAVLSTLMLHHLPRPVRADCVREAARVLRSGGRLLAVDFATPTARKKGLISHLHRHGGVKVDAIVALLRDAGLEVEAIGAVGVSDLHYVIGVKPAPGDHARHDDVPVTRSLDPLATPRWIFVVAAIAIVATHTLWVQPLLSRMTLSTAGPVAGAIALLLVAAHARGPRS